MAIPPAPFEPVGALRALADLPPWLDGLVKAADYRLRPDLANVEAARAWLAEQTAMQQSITVLTSRGEPKPPKELLELAGLRGPDASHSSTAVLIGVLRSKPDEWRSAFKLIGKKRGSALENALITLKKLEKAKLVESRKVGKPDNPKVHWRLAQSAFI